MYRRNWHVQVYWNTLLHSPSNCSRSFLRSSVAFFLPDSGLYVSQLLSSYCLFLVSSLSVSSYFIHALLLFLLLFPNLSLSILSPLPASAASFLYFHLHHHSPPSLQHTYFVTANANIRLEWRITEIMQLSLTPLHLINTWLITCHSLQHTLGLKFILPT